MSEEIPLIGEINVEELKLGQTVKAKLTTGEIVTIKPFTPVRMFRAIGTKPVNPDEPFDIGLILECCVSGVDAENILFPDFTPLLSVIDKISGGILSGARRVALFQRESNREND